MKKQMLVFSVFILIVLTINAQNYEYSINLEQIKEDQVTVNLNCLEISSEDVIYYFPKTVPGTYSELDYGRYISNFSAYNEQGEKLPVKKIDVNSYLISNAKLLQKIQYVVDDTWDEKVRKKHKILEPAGTSFEAKQYFILNAGGIFGCIEGMEDLSFQVDITASDDVIPYTSLVTENKDGVTRFYAKNYHQLIDCPIFYTNQKTAEIKVGDCQVNIAVYSENGSVADSIKKDIVQTFSAIEKFTDPLPVKAYNLLIYLKDMSDIGERLADGKISIGDIFKLMKVMKQGFGALEHGTSSVYFLPDMGADNALEGVNYTKMIKDIVAHEFMHVYTPLNLHSEMIGDFDYRDPKMSKHLWLYEGITEYFSIQLLMQGGVRSIDETLFSVLRGTMKQAAKYSDNIPFTEMSARVFEKDYQDLYLHVYDKGAMIGMLLDFEIMKLTQGKKTLKSVVFELVEKYGENQSFDENRIISEFVSLVHPDLQNFFANYVTGTKPLDYKAGFDVVGINYESEKEMDYPVNILSKKDNDVKKKLITVANISTIKKVGKGDIVGFQKGDKVNRNDIDKAFKIKAYGFDFVPKGTPITIEVERDGKMVPLTFPARYKKATVTHFMENKADKTSQQQQLFDIWTKGK